MNTFLKRIETMNAMYKLPMHGLPMLPVDVPSRLAKFKKTLCDEVDEIDDIIALAKLEDVTDLVVATAIADLLADVVVYCASEALKYGLPLLDTLHIVMDSNESKLGADGKPIYNAEGKFLKGPNYYKPEPAIEKRLKSGVGIRKGGWE